MTEHSIADDGEGAFRFHYDPAIAMRFAVPIMLDIVLWPLWESVECPVLILRGESSDLLSVATVEEMQRRGPAAHAGHVHVAELANCGHAPSLMDRAQITIVRDFLRGSGERDPSTADRRVRGRSRSKAEVPS